MVCGVHFHIPCYCFVLLGGGFTSKRGIFGKKGESTTMLCVAFDKQQDGAHSGGANGLVYHWKGNQLTGTVKAHQGPVFAMLAVEKVCLCVCVCVCVYVCMPRTAWLCHAGQQSPAVQGINLLIKRCRLDAQS